jgi:UDP-N-acetylmuramate: L-alanyl-gamma-D-glutamyl-meso-diaminopimelate ligase
LPPETPALDSIRHVHLIAVCGTAMGTLACMLAEQGFRVSGSDVAAYPPMSEQLAEAGIAVQKGYHPEHVLRERPELVVIGNAVRSDNPEARTVLEAGIPYLSFSDAVYHLFMRGKHSLVVAGTHGKTTTTSLLGWILAHVGLDPSVLIGGVSENLGRSFRLGEGPHFVIEGDEYDTAFFDKTPKFLHYAPRAVLLTSCEFDHADIYSSLEQIERAFRALLELVPADGHIVAAADPAVARLCPGLAAPVESYGFHGSALWKVSDVAFDAAGTTFTVWRGEQTLGQVRLPLFGRHNVENALGALALAHAAAGVPVEASARALEAFTGVRRRQEVRGEERGVVVVDDFAHHPTAVRHTIAAMRARYPDRRLWAVFEPRTNTSRRRFFEEAYVDALAGADRVLIADTYRAEQIPEAERMRPARVAEALAARGVAAHHLAEVDQMIEQIVHGRSGRDVALIMSNGEFEGIWDRLLARLRRAD